MAEMLDAFVELRKASVSFIMSLCLSVNTEQPGSHQTKFLENLYLCIFLLSMEKKVVSLASGKSNACLHEDKYTFIIDSL
jgi:hypothetical protein